jgi:hypothetical protein
MVIILYSSNLQDQCVMAELIQNFKISLSDAFLFINAPVKLASAEVKEAFIKFADSYSKGISPNLNDNVDLDISSTSNDYKEVRENLRHFETQHQIIMLYIWLSMRFSNFDQIELASRLKVQCEDLINDTLSLIYDGKNVEFMQHGTSRMKQFNQKINKDYSSNVSRDDEY